MFGSKSDYFKQSKEELTQCHEAMCELLCLKGYSVNEVSVYSRAFMYFIDNPTDFDGATLVNDLCDIPGLDIDALLHDYHYVICNVGASITYKWRADRLFFEGLKRKNKDGILYKLRITNYPAYSRLLGLTVADVFFVPFAFLKRGRMSPQQKELFLMDYVILNK